MDSQIAYQKTFLWIFFGIISKPNRMRAYATNSETGAHAITLQGLMVENMIFSEHLRRWRRLLRNTNYYNGWQTFRESTLISASQRLTHRLVFP